MVENRYAALLRRHDRTAERFIPVPLGQSLEMDEDGATRKWLWPHLGTEWHLVEFVPVLTPASTETNDG